MHQLKKAKIETENVLANQYLPVDNGLYFIAPVREMKMVGDGVQIIKSKGRIFLNSGKTFALLNDKIADHLNKAMNNNETIIITFSFCHPENYEIQDSFTIKMNKTECATIIGFYSVFREQILQETKKAVNE